MSKIIVLILTLFFAFGCNSKTQTKPNIVLIMTDDLNDYNEDLKGPSTDNFSKHQKIG